MNTTIIYPYLTLPHNGRIQQKSVIKRIGKIQVDTKRCLNKSAKAEQKLNRLVLGPKAEGKIHNEQNTTITMMAS